MLPDFAEHIHDEIQQRPVSPVPRVAATEVAWRTTQRNIKRCLVYRGGGPAPTPSNSLWRIDTNPRQPLPRPTAYRLPRLRQGLADVTNDTAGLDVEGNVPDRQPSLIAEGGDESQKAPDVGKVRSHTNGRANGTGALVASVLR